MNITVKKGSIADAPTDVTRIRLVTGTDAPRFEREDGADTLIVSAGKPEELTLRKFRILCRRIITASRAHKLRSIAIDFGQSPEIFSTLRETVSPELAAQTASENFEMANFEFNQFKTKPKDGWQDVERVLVYTREDSARVASARGQAIGQAVNACRALANTPAGDMTPTLLAKAAKDAVKGLPVKVTVLGAKEMQKLGMGAVLGVAKGSVEKPAFIILEYKSGKELHPTVSGRPTRSSTSRLGPIVLAGKGITFDSGGLNIKGSPHMYEMHMDMSGAAAAIEAVALAARLKVKQSVVALIPAAENMLGHNAMRPGDVLKSLSGKTIEVIDTDAEGRLVLADALTYAKRFTPSVVIDIATLTGAAMTALGLHASALLTRDDALATKIEASAEASGDYVWRLPLWDEYEDRVKGTFADLKNVPGGSTSRLGGAIDGGMFLWQFAQELECPWAHLDIAPRMTSTKGDELAEGAAGEPVRLLFHLICHFQ